MTTAELKTLLDQVTAGELDALTPEQIDALANSLDESPEQAARLSAVRPPALSARLDGAISLPSAGEWSAMFAQIEAAGSKKTRGGSGVLRLWRAMAPFAAAAACVLAVSLFSSLSRPAQADFIALDADVEIEAMEVGEGSSSIIVSSDEDEHFAVIWAVDDGPSSDADDETEPAALMVGAPE
jgi:hypothetical protein